MIQNLDAHLNKLQAQCDYLRHKLSTFPEGELSLRDGGDVREQMSQPVHCKKTRSVRFCPDALGKARILRQRKRYENRVFP